MEAVFDFNGTILEGSIPRKHDKLVEAWIEIHKEDLDADWRLLQNGMEHFRIPPLQ